MRTPLRRRRSRLFVTAVSSLLMLLLASQSTLAAVTWTSAVKTSYDYGFNYGQGLARTTQGTTSYLHTQYTVPQHGDGRDLLPSRQRVGDHVGHAQARQRRRTRPPTTARSRPRRATSTSPTTSINDWDDYDPTRTGP